MKIRLTQIDGKLPNLALMKLAHWHKSKGDEVYFSRFVDRDLFEPDYDQVYGSTIFKFSQPLIDRFKSNFPKALIGGTGTTDLSFTVESIIGQEYENYDYSIYPEYPYSIGFTARGCRLNCGFCVVPKKEGKPRPVNSIFDIWRTDTEKKVCLLDNDFFGQPKTQLEQRVAEIIDNKFKVCFNQGINIRLIDETAAEHLANIKYYDDQFNKRRLYTAWDNLRDEKIFFRGVDMLEKAGVPPTHLMVYMLIGYDKSETFERIFYRFNRMVERGIRPYPMVFDRTRLDLRKFQRWVIRRYYEICSFEEFCVKNQGLDDNTLF